MSPIPLGPFAFSLLLVGAFAAVRLHRVVQRSKRRQRLVRLLPTIALYTQGELGAYDVSGKFAFDESPFVVWLANATNLLGFDLQSLSSGESADSEEFDYWAWLELRIVKPNNPTSSADLRRVVLDGSTFEVITPVSEIASENLDALLATLASPLAGLVSTLDRSDANIYMCPLHMTIEGVTATDDESGKLNLNAALKAATHLKRCVALLRSTWPRN